MKKYLFILLTVIIIFSLCACDANTATETASAPTVAPTITESPTTAPTEAPTPTETVDKNEQLKAEAVKNATDFLNIKGDLTDEAIKTIDCNHENIPIGETELGLMMSVEKNSPNVCLQGVLLGYFERGGDIITVMGFKDSDKNRFVTVTKIPTSFYDRLENQLFYIGKTYGRFNGGNIDWDDIDDISSEVMNKLKLQKNTTVVCNILVKPILESDMLKENTVELQNIQTNWLNSEINDKCNLAIKLSSQTYRNSNEFGLIITKEVEILKITKVEDLHKIIEVDDLLIPAIIEMYYQPEE